MVKSTQTFGYFKNKQKVFDRHQFLTFFIYFSLTKIFSLLHRMTASQWFTKKIDYSSIISIKRKILTVFWEKAMASIRSPGLPFLQQAAIFEVAVATIVQICFCRFCCAVKPPNPDFESIFTHRMPPWLFSRLWLTMIISSGCHICGIAVAAWGIGGEEAGSNRASKQLREAVHRSKGPCRRHQWIKMYRLERFFFLSGFGNISLSFVLSCYTELTWHAVC